MDLKTLAYAAVVGDLKSQHTFGNSKSRCDFLPTNVDVHMGIGSFTVSDFHACWSPETQRTLGDSRLESEITPHKLARAHGDWTSEDFVYGPVHKMF